MLARPCIEPPPPSSSFYTPTRRVLAADQIAEKLPYLLQVGGLVPAAARLDSDLALNTLYTAAVVHLRERNDLAVRLHGALPPLGGLSDGPYAATADAAVRLAADFDTAAFPPGPLGRTPFRRLHTRFRVRHYCDQRCPSCPCEVATWGWALVVSRCAS